MWLRSLVVTVVIAFVAGCDAYVSGSNSQGQLGLASSGSAGVPAVGGPWSTMVAGPNTTCGIYAAGSLWCWGDNSRGQTGNGTIGGDQLTPGQVGAFTDWQQVDMGARHTCGIRSGQLWCWGGNNYGQIGNNASNTAIYSSPQRVGTASDWTSVSLGQWHSCGIRAGGNLYCWGLNTSGQVGNNSLVTAFTPQAVTLGPWQSVDAGNNHTCALRQNVTGSLLCWGSNSHGQLGTSHVAVGDLLARPLFGIEFGSAPPHISFNLAPTKWLSVSAGSHSSCAIMRSIKYESPFISATNVPPEIQTLWCWGKNDQGQITDESIGVDATLPTIIGSRDGNYLGFTRFLDLYSSVSVGGEHVCAIRYDTLLTNFWGTDYGSLPGKQVACKGANDFNQLAISTHGGASTVSVSAGGFHSALLWLNQTPAP